MVVELEVAALEKLLAINSLPHLSELTARASERTTG